MKFSTGAIAASAAINLEEQSRILNHIKTYPTEEGTLAKKAYNRSIIISLLIIFLVAIPLCIYTMSQLSSSKLEYPKGATKEIRGHVALYEEKFWYTDSSKKYEFDLNKYTTDTNFEPGEIISIYLDDNNNVISISHQENESDKGINIVIMFLIPIVLLLLHAFVGRQTYCKWWSMYVQWYQKEIEPYRFQENFKEIISNKKFYDVRVRLQDLTIEEQKLYRKSMLKAILYSLLLLLCIITTIYLCIKFNLNTNNWIVILSIIIYVGIFYVLIDNCDVEMHRIKSGYYKKENL